MAQASPAPARASAPEPASPPGYPTPDMAFGLAPHRTDDKGWFEPVHGERVIPIRGGFALLMKGAERDCHACMGELSVAYFHRVGGGWVAYRDWSDVYEGGAWGGNFDIEPIDLGQPNPTVELGYGYGNGGFDEGFSTVLELTPHGPVTRIDNAMVSYDDSGFTDEPDLLCSIDGKILRGRNGAKAFVRYRGFGRRHAKVDVLVRYDGRGETWTPQPRKFKVVCAGHDIWITP